MGQEHSCQTSLRTAAGSTVSTTADKVQRTGEDIAGTANAMAERSDSLPLPDSDSTTIDSPAERTGSSDKDDFSSEPLEPDTPNTTLPPSDALEEQLRPRRELRPSNDFKRVIPSTWIDADDTGDFDPQEENRRSRPCRKRTKLSHRKRFDWTGENTTARLDARPQIKTKPEPEPEPPLCLRFKSSFGKTAFRVLCATLQDEVTPARDHFNEGYELRRRNAVSDGSSLDNARATTTGLRVLAAEQNCDYSNHPMARGCLKCMASGLECSLLEDEHSWPCNDCKLEDFECQLFQEPEYKRACTHCQYLGKRQRWLVCSFEYSQDPSEHQGRCEQCQKDRHESCVAGPRPGTTRTRLRIGENGLPFENQAKGVPKTPRISTCMRCLESQRICSLASQPMRDTGAICTACDMSGEACELLGPDIPRIPPDTLDEANTVDDKISIPSELLEDVELTPTPPASRPDTSSGTIKTVLTKFCHPMQFDYHDQTTDGSDPCHFCSCAHFGIIGLDERKAEIIEWADGRGWEEVGGGHKGDDVKGTQMCTACTMARMQIMICPDHAFRRIAAPATDLALQEALERVLSGETGDRWCSVCCNLANWECCIAQEDEPGEGCGLALCEQCVSDLEVCEGSFDIMLQLLEEDGPSEARPAGLRADYQLLKQDGLLIRYLDWSAAKT